MRQVADLPLWIGTARIFTREGLAEILNHQPKDGQAKPYPARQVRKLIQEHGLGGDPDDESNTTPEQATPEDGNDRQ